MNITAWLPTGEILSKDPQTAPRRSILQKGVFAGLFLKIDHSLPQDLQWEPVMTLPPAEQTKVEDMAAPVLQRFYSYRSQFIDFGSQPLFKPNSLHKEASRRSGLNDLMRTTMKMTQSNR
jgi:hypothetical protein